jgi:hypothetical protein
MLFLAQMHFGISPSYLFWEFNLNSVHKCFLGCVMYSSFEVGFDLESYKIPFLVISRVYTGWLL